MKKVIFILLSAFLLLQAEDIVVFQNDYKVLPLPGKLKKLIVGDKKIINVSVLDDSKRKNTLLKIFGKKSGNTSILFVFRDGTIKNYHVFVNKNLGFVQKMINHIAPHIKLSRVGDGSIVLSGNFDDPHQKKRVYVLLENAGLDLKHLMDITKTAKVNKMIRTKLYLVEINNNRAKELGGVTGLGLVNQKASISLNPDALTGVTFSGWLLNNAQSFSVDKGFSLLGTLKLLQSKGVAHILDDTVLITTEDKNASFHVGGDVYIPIGITQTNGGYPTIQLEEKEYGLRLTLTTNFMEKKDYMHLEVTIRDSEFDPNKEHNVKLGGDNGAFSQGIEVPSFLSKHITTDIVAKSKQVIALGGRLHKDETEIEQKIPLLGDLPIIGALFRSTEKRYKANDLLFFLVPEIVDANKAVDDSKYYKQLDKEAKEFHKNFILDKSKEDSKKNDASASTINSMEPIEVEFEEKEKSVTPNEAKQQPDTEVAETTNQAIKEESIVLLDNGSEVEDRKTSQVASPRNGQEMSKSTKISDKETELSTADENRIDKENKHVLQNETKEKKVYEINISKMFIRKKPLNGKVVDVWAKGHRFISNGEKSVGGIVWLKITKDCGSGECQEVNGPLWVSKRYSKEILHYVEK